MSTKNKIEKSTTEVNEMSDTKTESNLEELAKKELSREEKKRQRRDAIQTRGRLQLDEEFKEKGYRYRPVNVLPGNIEKFKSMGYEIVTHPISSGSGSLKNPEADGSSSEFEVGGSLSGSMKAVWMRTTEDNAQILREIEDDKAREQAEMINKVPGIPDANLVGKITKENLK